MAKVSSFVQGDRLAALLARMEQAKRLADWPSVTEWRDAGGKYLEYPLPPSTLK